MQNIKHPREIESLLRDKNLTTKAAENFRDNWARLSLDEQLSYSKNFNHPIITDREIQENILRNLQKIEASNRVIKKNWQFFFWVGLIPVIIYIIYMVIYS